MMNVLFFKNTLLLSLLMFVVGCGANSSVQPTSSQEPPSSVPNITTPQSQPPPDSSQTPPDSSQTPPDSSQIPSLLDEIRNRHSIPQLREPDEDFISSDPSLLRSQLISCSDTEIAEFVLCVRAQRTVPGLFQYHQVLSEGSEEKYLTILDSNVESHGSGIRLISETIANNPLIPDNRLYKGILTENGELVASDDPDVVYITKERQTNRNLLRGYRTAKRDDIVSMSLTPLFGRRGLRPEHLTEIGALLVLPTGNDGEEHPNQGCEFNNELEQTECHSEEVNHRRILEAGETGLLLLVTGFDALDLNAVYDRRGRFVHWKNDDGEIIDMEDIPLHEDANHCGIAKEFCIAASWYAPIESTDSGIVFSGGTSNSTIIVSTTLALVKEQWPILSARELRDIALSCAIDAGPDPDGDGISDFFGHGILSIACLFEPIEELEVASREVQGGASLPGLSPSSRLTGYDAYERDFAFTFAQEFGQASRVLPGGEKVAILVSHGDSASFSFKERDLFQPTEETLQTGFIVGGETVKSFIQASDGDFPVMVGMTQSLGTAVSSWISYGIERGFFGGSGTGSFEFDESQHVQGGLTAGYAVSEGLTLKSWGLIDYGWTKGVSSESLIESLRGYEVRGGLEASYEDGGMRVSFQAVGSSGVQGRLRLEDDIGTFPLRGSPEAAFSLKWAYTF